MLNINDELDLSDSNTKIDLDKLNKIKLCILRDEYKLMHIASEIKNNNFDTEVAKAISSEVETTLKIVRTYIEKINNLTSLCAEVVLTEQSKDNINTEVVKLVRADAEFAKTICETTDLKIGEFKEMLAIVDYCNDLLRRCKRTFKY